MTSDNTLIMIAHTCTYLLNPYGSETLPLALANHQKRHQWHSLLIILISS
jgi:hypothetical protein